ncbi:hypothetical protein AN958_07640 [Leucoagaricus sp. SymC.cos]|nr:hypothetical protein AN958_07640 [Leucoagaricus sp. SymC.cos]
MNFLAQDSVLRVLSLPTLTEVLSFLKSRQVHISAPAIGRIVQRFISLDHPSDISQLLSYLHPCLLHELGRLQRHNPHSVSYTPPAVVRTSLLFLHAFLPIDQEKALAIFRILVDSGHIPPEAMVDSSSSQTLEQIISMSLVKTSLYWDWNGIAGNILVQLLQSSSTPNSFIIRHTIDCLYSLLISPSSNGLQGCLNIIRNLHPHSPVPDSIVRQFYECATDINAPHLAAQLYEFSQEDSVSGTHRYPAPQGRALSRLMFHLAGGSKKVHLVRKLASDAVQDHLPIPLNDRAQFIAAIAEKGIASPARALWEMYVTGKDGSLIYGDSGLMVRMVSLFTNLAQRPGSEVPGSEAGELENPQMTKASDFRSFVHHVVAKFKEHHEPWENADHRAMTSFARACFIIGKNTEGFDIFKVLLGRLELPDLYDVNVALSAIAKQAPSSAATMIERMEENGLVPDAVTFGTVLHHATVQKCPDVVNQMVERITKLESWQRDVQVFGTVVRAVVQPEADDTLETRVLKLQSAWELVRRFTEGGSQVSTQIGNYLVPLAVQAQDVTLAFNFWRALLKESADKDDGQQRHQRFAIIGLALRQSMQGDIDGSHIRMIINELGGPDG